MAWILDDMCVIHDTQGYLRECVQLTPLHQFLISFCNHKLPHAQQWRILKPKRSIIPISFLNILCLSSYPQFH